MNLFGTYLFNALKRNGFSVFDGLRELLSTESRGTGNEVRT